MDFLKKMLSIFPQNKSAVENMNKTYGKILETVAIICPVYNRYVSFWKRFERNTKSIWFDRKWIKWKWWTFEKLNTDNNSWMSGERQKYIKKGSKIYGEQNKRDAARSR